MTAQYEFDPIDLSFKGVGPSFFHNPWVPFYTFQKSVGSTEPTKPMLTTVYAPAAPEVTLETADF